MNSRRPQEPRREVASVAPAPAGWARVAFVIVGFSLLSLVLSWTVVPLVGMEIVKISRLPPRAQVQGMLVADLILSCCVFFIGCYIAGRIARGRVYWAAFGVGAIGWLAYFVQAGGLSGMLDGPYPMWYEFFPVHWGAALAGARFAVRRAG